MVVKAKLDSIRSSEPNPSQGYQSCYVEVMLRDVRLMDVKVLLSTPLGEEIAIVDRTGFIESQPPSMLQAQLRELEEMFNKQRAELVMTREEARRLQRRLEDTEAARQAAERNNVRSVRSAQGEPPIDIGEVVAFVTDPVTPIGIVIGRDGEFLDVSMDSGYRRNRVARYRRNEVCRLQRGLSASFATYEPSSSPPLSREDIEAMLGIRPNVRAGEPPKPENPRFAALDIEDGDGDDK